MEKKTKILTVPWSKCPNKVSSDNTAVLSLLFVLLVYGHIVVVYMDIVRPEKVESNSVYKQTLNWSQTSSLFEDKVDLISFLIEKKPTVIICLEDKQPTVQRQQIIVVIL